MGEGRFPPLPLASAADPTVFRNMGGDGRRLIGRQEVKESGSPASENIAIYYCSILLKSFRKGYVRHEMCYMEQRMPSPGVACVTKATHRKVAGACSLSTAHTGSHPESCKTRCRVSRGSTCVRVLARCPPHRAHIT